MTGTTEAAEGRAVVNRLATFGMLGRMLNERIAMANAVKAVPTDPDEWEGPLITTAMWAGDFADDLTEKIPTLIEQQGCRPQRAVATLVQYAVRFGIEVGRQLERQATAEVSGQ